MTVSELEPTHLPWQTCELCGALGVDAHPRDATVVLACGKCAHEEERNRVPFFSITGPSGSGKSTLLRRLWRLLPECVAFDGDVLWHGDFWNDRAAYYARWLAVAAQASQPDRPVIVCTAAMPDDWRSDFAVLVGEIHMLALVCDEDELLARLTRRDRPQDPQTPGDFLEQTCNFNRWLRARVAYVDTSLFDPDETAARVADWVRERL
jgi:energy-coupling factor transporter ATP-binding protein EcfA2